MGLGILQFLQRLCLGYFSVGITLGYLRRKVEEIRYDVYCPHFS